jgi:hypothetical protein
VLFRSYSIQYDPANWVDLIPWEKDFDYEIIKEDINLVANTLINEPWPLLRVLWLAMGAFKLHVEFEPERDLKEFGYVRYPRGGEHRLWGTYNFEIDSFGNWTAHFDTRLQADPYQDQLLDFHHVYDGDGHWQRPLETNINLPLQQTVL